MNPNDRTLARKKRARFPVVVTLIVVLIWMLLLSGFVPSFQQQGTPPFRDAEGQIRPGSIAEERTITLGGWDQYVLIRGENSAAPLLVFLHGGPGTPETGLIRRYNAELEQHFVVVLWEQRGAGRSYSRDLDPETLTLAQLLSDLDELVDSLLAEFDKSQVLLVGHSFGTELGIAYASAHPSKVAGYIGVCQETDVPRSEAEGYEWALEQARERNDRRAVRRLEAIGPPPYPMASTRVQRKYVWKYGGAFHGGQSMASVVLASLGAQEIGVRDLLLYSQGQKASLDVMWPQIVLHNANERYPAVDVPVWFFLGRHDHHVSATLAEEYFERLEAPTKEVVWFEESAHNPPYEEPARFNAEVIRVGQDLFPGLQ